MTGQKIAGESKAGEKRGHQRRKRMRAHLLNSVMIVCSGADGAVIDDVIRHAGVSRGTFYKYFDSLDEAIAERARDMADEMASGEGIKTVHDLIPDPVMRVATGFQLYLIRALIEPEWGRFFCHVGLLDAGVGLANKIVRDIDDGVRSYDFDIPSVEIALDMLIGTKVEAIQRIISGAVGADYIRDVTALILKALGISSLKARYVSQLAFQQICADAPHHLPWWKPLKSLEAKRD